MIDIKREIERFKKQLSEVRETDEIISQTLLSVLIERLTNLESAVGRNTRKVEALMKSQGFNEDGDREEPYY